MQIVSRSGWGAVPPKGRPVAIKTPVAQLVLHHSAGQDGGPETVRAIQRFHMRTRGWSDIAYTWLYSPELRTFFEGRGPGVAQAAQSGHNRNSHSVCVLGNFEREPVLITTIEDLGVWARWHRKAGHGPGQYIGHRQLGTTACPGTNLFNQLGRINDLADGDTPVQPAIPPTLRRGDRGDDVRLAQAAVGAKVDGVFGPNTEAAVKQFQRDNGLVADGIVGPRTWEVILS